jgi:hypothetical protein
VARVLAKYRLDLLVVQVMWDKEGTEGVEEYTFFHGKEIENYQL